MADIGELRARITADSSEFNSAVNQAKGSMDDFGSSLQQIGNIAAGIGLVELTNQFIQFGSAVVGTAQDLEFISNNLNNLTGSAEKTDEILSRVGDLADKGLFKTEQVEGFTQKLLQMGIPQEKVATLMDDMAAASVGSSTSLTEASGKMATLTSLFGYLNDRGELSVTMLGRFSKTLGIPLFAQIAKDMGMTTDQMSKLGSKVKITADDVQKAFNEMATGSGIFAKSINSATDTMIARQNALKNQFEELGLSILGVSKTGEVIKGGAFDVLSTQLKNLGDWIKAHRPEIDEFFLNVKTMLTAIEKALNPVVDAFFRWQKDHPKWNAVMLIAVAIMGVLAVSLGIIATAVGTVGLAFVAVSILIGEVVVIISKLWEQLQARWEMLRAAFTLGLQEVIAGWQNFRDKVLGWINDIIGAFTHLVDQAKKAFDAINPLKPKSPPLTDQVRQGMEFIRHQFELTSNMKIVAPSFTPPPMSAYSQNNSYVSQYTNQPSSSQVINNTFVVGNSQSAKNLSEFLAFQLTHKGLT